MTPDLETLSLDADGLRFHALAAGPADGPLVLLLHGFPETSGAWAGLMAPLAAAGLRVVAPDQRGVGLSSKPPGAAAYRIGRLGDDIVALVRALGRERARVVGHDWGGAVAWTLAMRHADVVERCAILNAPHPAVFVERLKRHPSQRAKSWYMLFFQLPWLPEAMLRADDFARLERALRESSRDGAFTPAAFAELRAAWSQPGALTGMLNWYRAMRPGPGAGTRAASRIEVPVRLLWGDRDFALDVELAQASIARCASGELFHLHDATHWLHREEPERVAGLLVEFLR